MSRARNTFRKFVQDKTGLELVEYAIMTALIVVAMVLAIIGLSKSTTERLEDVEETITEISDDD